ncbi:MAG: electron transfer flavoprotein subunit alpha/FixB family protein [Actinomycetota bacterium]|nr:electron transfer flavoprotein subunit alpha/FixB family protein [Acidimicrobiia bacterium]MDQ3146779.1 electron transfer flavoprotein subunit alpha/FixB family protein [Actinomycetota bacterium]
MSLSKIWVHAEMGEGKPASISLELISKARSLADTVEAFCAADHAEDLAAEVGKYGVSKLYAVDTKGSLQGVPLASAVAAQVEAGNAPDLIMFGSTYDGRDVLARLSVELDRPTLTNSNAIEVEGDEVRVTTSIFGGATNVTTAFRCPAPHLAGFRPKSFAAEEGGATTAEVVAIEATEAGKANVLERHVEEHEGPVLDEANVVVSGGRGLGDAEKYAMVEDLAKLLKGAPGASRAIVDAGWVPYSHQVGQTGKVVKPDVYVAIGISGATQHMVGMKGSKNIIAINKDRDAPIFSIADLGIVGDVHKVLPKLIEELKGRA